METNYIHRNITLVIACVYLRVRKSLVEPKPSQHKSSESYQILITDNAISNKNAISFFFSYMKLSRNADFVNGDRTVRHIPCDYYNGSRLFSFSLESISCFACQSLKILPDFWLHPSYPGLFWSHLTFYVSIWLPDCVGMVLPAWQVSQPCYWQRIQFTIDSAQQRPTERLDMLTRHVHICSCRTEFPFCERLMHSHTYTLVKTLPNSLVRVSVVTTTILRSLFSDIISSKIQFDAGLLFLTLVWLRLFFWTRDNSVHLVPHFRIAHTVVYPESLN